MNLLQSGKIFPTRRHPCIWIFCDGGLGAGDYRGLDDLSAIEAHGERHVGGGQSLDLGTGRAQGKQAGGNGKQGDFQVTNGVVLKPGCGAIVRSARGDVLDWAWRTLPRMTNNEAEYAGLLLGVALARTQRASEIIFVLDSDIVVGQICGRYAVNSPALKQWHRRAKKALGQLRNVKFCHVPREWNSLADALARQASLPWPQLRAEVERRVEGA